MHLHINQNEEINILNPLRLRIKAKVEAMTYEFEYFFGYNIKKNYSFYLIFWISMNLYAWLQETHEYALTKMLIKF